MMLTQGGGVPHSEQAQICEEGCEGENSTQILCRY